MAAFGVQGARAGAWSTRARFPLLTSAVIVAGWLAGVAVTHRTATPASSSLVAARDFILGWLLMVAAMMLPLTLAPVRDLRNRTSGAPGPVEAPFLAGFMFVWSVTGLVALAARLGIMRAAAFAPWITNYLGFSLVVIMFFGGLRISFATRDCCAGAPLQARDKADAIRSGSRFGKECLRDCWMLMLVPGLLGAHGLIWMAGLTLLMLALRSGRRPQRFAVAPAAVLLALTVGTLAVTIPTAGAGQLQASPSPVSQSLFRCVLSP